MFSREQLLTRPLWAESAKLMTEFSCRIDVNEEDTFGYKPLHYAALKGHNEVAEFLLKNDADPNAEGDSVRYRAATGPRGSWCAR